MGEREGGTSRTSQWAGRAEEEQQNGLCAVAASEDGQGGRQGRGREAERRVTVELVISVVLQASTCVWAAAESSTAKLQASEG